MSIVSKKDLRVLFGAVFVIIFSIVFLYVGLTITEHYVIKNDVPIEKELVFHKIKYPYEAYQKEQAKPEPKKPEPKFKFKITQGTTPNSIVVDGNVEIFYKKEIMEKK